MKFLAGLTALASAASAVSVSGKRDSPLDVKLEMVGKTSVKASVTNTGAPLKVFTTGTFLDKAPVEKVKITQGQTMVPFGGAKLQIATSGLSESAFTTIKTGQTLTTEFDVAELHDLSSGGAFDIFSEGALPTAAINSTKLSGAVQFASNVLSTKVAATDAIAARDGFVKRTNVQNDCSGSELSATTDAIARCESLAADALSETSNSARMEEYFKSSDASTTAYVADVFSNVQSECSSTSSGASDYYCSDVYGACSPGVLAYTLPSQSYMVNCPLFFSGLPATSNQCHAQDQQTTVLHEMTHLREVAGTDDYGGYGYDFVQSLTPAQNLNHADTYTLFAQSIYAGC